MNNSNVTICEAIQKRIVIKFVYKGETRIVEPFTYGYHKANDNLMLCAYQVGGYSESGETPPWRLYEVSKITDLTNTSMEAQSWRPLYNPNDKRMSRIICKC